MTKWYCNRCDWRGDEVYIHRGSAECPKCCHWSAQENYTCVPWNDDEREVDHLSAKPRTKCPYCVNGKRHDCHGDVFDCPWCSTADDLIPMER